MKRFLALLEAVPEVEAEAPVAAPVPLAAGRAVRGAPEAARAGPREVWAAALALRRSGTPGRGLGGLATGKNLRIGRSGEHQYGRGPCGSTCRESGFHELCTDRRPLPRLHEALGST